MSDRIFLVSIYGRGIVAATAALSAADGIIVPGHGEGGSTLPGTQQVMHAQVRAASEAEAESRVQEVLSGIAAFTVKVEGEIPPERSATAPD